MRELALRELLRGRLGTTGPTTAADQASALAVSEADVFIALVALEAEGVVLRGHFIPKAGDATPLLEWCDRRLLARIHRYTLNRLRAEIEPVSAADFMRFLFVWQRVDPEHNVAGLAGLAGIVEQLDGFEVPAGAWEADVLASRCAEYDPALLDTLCLTGRVAWGRTSGRNGSENGNAPTTRSAGPIRTTPVALFLRETAQYWLPLAAPIDDAALSEYGRRVHEAVLANKDTESGITIHYVDELYDHGNIIYQATCPVVEEDTPDTLAQKIHLLEHASYPAIIEKTIQLQNQR